MFESFVILLREGIEAALVIAILVVTLRRTGRHALQRAVAWGVGLALTASVAAAWWLERLPINQEGYEGVLYLVSAVFVGSMMWWMQRNARDLRRQIESRVERMATGENATAGQALAVGGFTFLMIFREGAETVLFLGAVRLTTDAMLSFLGALLGLAAAVTFGVLFVRGTLRVDLRRFFFVTEWVLGIFVVQLLVNGYHELAEAGWVWATPTTMSLVGPIVRHGTLFTLSLVAIPLLIWVSGRSDRPAAPQSASAAERRLHQARLRRDALYRRAAFVAGLIVLTVVGIAYARELTPRTLSPPEPVSAVDGIVSIPLVGLEQGVLRRFGIPIDGHLVRFLALKLADGSVELAYDACEICGVFGYTMEAGQLLCVNCAALIPVSTMGNPGGCNPIPLPSRIDGGSVQVSLADLARLAAEFERVDRSGEPVAGVMTIDPLCGMQVRPAEAHGTAAYRGRTFHFCSERCAAAFRRDPARFAG